MEKDSIYDGLTDEESEDLEKVQKEMMELMDAESKPNFNNI